MCAGDRVKVLGVAVIPTRLGGRELRLGRDDKRIVFLQRRGGGIRMQFIHVIYVAIVSVRSPARCNIDRQAS